MIDNICELEKISLAYDATGVEPKLGVRMNPGLTLNREWSRFGLSFDVLPSFLDEMSQRDLTLSGLHFHLGSGIKKPGIYSRALANVGQQLRKEFFNDVREDLKFIDVGGGFSSGFGRHKDLLDYLFRFVGKHINLDKITPSRSPNFSSATPIDYFADSICSTFQNEIVPLLGDVMLWVEPGRSIAAESTHMLCKVLL